VWYLHQRERVLRVFAKAAATEFKAAYLKQGMELMIIVNVFTYDIKRA